MREDHLGRYQMLWSCPACGTEKLLGLDHRYCPNCGSPQAADKRYYPPEGEEVAVENHPYHGADRVCPACETPMSAAAAFCGSCGCPMDEAKAAAFKAEHRAGPPAAPPPPEPPKKSRGAPGLVGMGCALVLLASMAIFCGLAVFWKKEASVAVTGHSWERSVAVEKQALVSESAWKEQLPSGATEVRCQKEQKGTEKVQDGEECSTVKRDKGDGTFDKVNECKPKYRSEPVYGEKCSYKVMKWTTARTEKTGGKSSGDDPAWPQVRLAAGEREGARTATYTVHLKVDGEAKTCTPDEATWKRLQAGRTYKGKVAVIGGAVDCGSLK